VGVALAASRAKRLGVESRWPRDAVTVCSFGDASINHSTAVGALNAASYTAAQGLPLPLLFVCEDNGIGISVATPQGWVAQAAQRPAIRYVFADGWLYFGAASSLRTAIDHNVWVALAVAVPTERGRWASVVARGACYATEHTGTAVADAAALRGIIRLRKQGPSTSGGAHRKTRSSIIFRMHVEELRGRMVRAPCPPTER